MITARLSNYRQAPRKVRVVADTVRGKRVVDALNQLDFTVKRATSPLVKLIKSAVANAKNNHGLDVENLFIKEIRVDGGIVMKRSMPRARGSASLIHKRTSHVMITLAEKAPKIKNKKAKSQKLEANS